jgi:lysophospholipase L1-like esterase
LRGRLIRNSPEKVRILTIGGSTTDQRAITEGKTWQDVMGDELNMPVGNAGIDGQSTVGHEMNYVNWLPYIPGLKPDIVLFYVGINDFFRSGDGKSLYLKTDSGFMVKYKLLLKSNSFLYNSFRRIAGNKEAGKNKLGHHRNNTLNDSRVFTSISADSTYINKYRSHSDAFEARMDKLIGLTKSRWPGASIVLVSQPTAFFYNDSRSGKIMGDTTRHLLDGAMLNGADFGVCMRLNDERLKKLSEKYNGVHYLDLSAMQQQFTPAFYYDNVHMTPAGASWVGRNMARFILEKELNK